MVAIHPPSAVPSTPMTCHISKTHRACSSSTLTDIITYRYDDKLVYVPATRDYAQALVHVRKAFPQLNKLCDASLSLSLVSPGKDPKLVAISALAWPSLAAHLARYQIVDVHTRVPISIPDITITYADADDCASMAETHAEPPSYRGPDSVDDEKVPCPRPRSLSTTTLHGKRSWFFQRLYPNAS